MGQDKRGVALKKDSGRKRLPTPAAIARFEQRKAVVEAVQRGEPAGLVSRIHGVAERSVFRWLSWYRSKGWDGLRDGKRSGRPGKLSPEAIRWLYRVVTGGDPRQLQMEFALWTLNIIRAALSKHQGVTLSTSSVCRLMAQLGLTPQVPVYRSYRRNPGKVNYYLKARYPKLLEWARANGYAIYFADESRVRMDDHRGTTWAPCGATPVVVDSGDRFGVNMISAVSARGDMFFRCFEGMMDSARFIEFLKDLRTDAGRSILVIVDGGSYHTSKKVRTFLKEEGEQRGIRLEYLPPYSPELNPDEQVWNQAKSALGKLCVATKKELRDAWERTLGHIKDSAELVKSFFRMEFTRYANTPA
jgi:transposase